jgi:hypothetical protein
MSGGGDKKRLCVRIREEVCWVHVTMSLETNFGKPKHCSLEEKAPLIIEVYERKGSMEGTRKAPL